MTERFSPEYKAFILSDEAKVLQGQWKKRGVQIGDWVDARGFGQDAVGVIYASGGLSDDHWAVGLPELSTGRPDIHIHWLRWLPTLTDSLDMIEEAGWEWARSPGIWHAWKPTPVQGTAETWVSVNDTEDILAAAKLAVRVLKVKE